MNYLLSGTESFNLRKRKNEIIEKAVGKENEAYAVSVFRGSDETPLDEIVEDCRMLPLFCDNKVVVYENPLLAMMDEKKLEKENYDSLISYLKEPNESTTFIMVLDQSGKKGNSFLKNVRKYLKYEEFNVLTPDEFANLVNMDLNESNIKIDNKARVELLDRLPVSVENWKQELEKLKLYPGTLSVEAIRQLISKRLEDNAFSLSNAIMDGDRSRALAVLNELLNGKSEIMSLIGLIASNFRFMAQVKILSENGKNNSEIAQILNVEKEFRIKKAIQNAGRRSGMDLLKILSDLSRLDQDIKSGRVSDRSGLELFIIRNAIK